MWRSRVPAAGARNDVPPYLAIFKGAAPPTRPAAMFINKRLLQKRAERTRKRACTASLWFVCSAKFLRRKI